MIKKDHRDNNDKAFLITTFNTLFRVGEALSWPLHVHAHVKYCTSF